MIENYTRLSSRIFTATVVGKDQKGRKITEGAETYKTPSGVYEIKDWARHVEKAAEADGLLPLLEQIKQHVKEYAWMKNASDINVLILAAEAIDTQMVMGVNMRTGQIEIAEYDGQIRGQMDLSDFTDTDQDPEPEETQAAAPTPVQNPTGKPLDLKNRGKQAPAAAAELVPGRDYDPDTGEVYETAGQPTDDRQTTGGRNNMKVVKIAPAKEA